MKKIERHAQYTMVYTSTSNSKTINYQYLNTFTKYIIITDRYNYCIKLLKLLVKFETPNNIPTKGVRLYLSIAANIGSPNKLKSNADTNGFVFSSSPKSHKKKKKVQMYNV